MNDLESFGLFFEDFAIRDLRVYANYLGGEVKHYRDNTGLECDAIIILEDGRWGSTPPRAEARGYENMLPPAAPS